MGNKLGKNNRYVVSGREGGVKGGSLSQGNIKGDADSVISPPHMARRGSEGTASPALSEHEEDDIMTYSGLRQAAVCRMNGRNVTMISFCYFYILFYNVKLTFIHFCLDEPVYNSCQYRRKSVFAEAYNPEEDDGDDTKVRVNED